MHPIPLHRSAIVLSLHLTCCSSAALLGQNPPEFIYQHRVGLYDEPYRTWNGTFHSDVERWVPVTESGYIPGTTLYQAPGTTEYTSSQQAWVANGSGETWAVGLTDAAHTSAVGERWSQISFLTETGFAVGRSRRFDVSSWEFTYWTTEPGGPTVPFDGLILQVNDQDMFVGFTGSWSAPHGFIQTRTGDRTYIHLDADQQDYTLVYGLNQFGTASGRSWRSGDPLMDQDHAWAWIRKPDGEIRRVGMLDDLHTADSGRVRHYVGVSQTSDFASGSSQRFNGDSPNGMTAWIAHPDGRVVPVGFYGPDYLDNSGAPQGSIDDFNDLGYSVGTSSAFTHMTDRHHAWVADPEGNTQLIGIYDDVHTGPYGRQSSSPFQITNSGYIIGESVIFGGFDEDSYPVGFTAWIADITGATTPIGLASGESAARNHAVGVTESGYVWGRSDNHGAPGVETAWIYHHPTGTTTALVAPASIAGYSSVVHRVYEDGMAVGSFFQMNSTGEAPRAFVWTPDHGVVFVDEHLNIDPASAGWENFTDAVYRNADGILVGPGRLADGQGTGTYVVRLDEKPPGSDVVYIDRLGFYDTRHTHVSGFRWSSVIALADSGYSLGTSALFVGADDVPASDERRAQTAWRGDALGGTLRVGIYDAAHTRDDGRQESRPIALNERGSSIGTSTRFSGHASRGESAWLATATGQVRRLGLDDASLTGADGSRISRPVALNNLNQVVGYSLHPDTWAAAAWLGGPSGAMMRIGLTDSAHTAPGGSRVSLPFGINDQGHAAGISEYHVPGVATAGQSAWIRHTDGQHRMIGLTSGAHRAANGLHEVEVAFLNAESIVAGHATRYRSGQSTPLGQSAWLTPIDRPNRPIGFYSGLHAGLNNLAFSRVLGLNDQGFAIGYSQQFPAGSSALTDARGRTAWAATYDGGTVAVGLYDAAHSQGPFQHNDVRAQNDADALVGTARRFIAGADRGLDGWFAKSTGWTLKLALPGARYERGDGYARHVPRFVTQSHRVGGASARYHGAAEVGQTAWLFDVASRTYAEINLSVRASDQFAWSFLTDLRDDGTAFGVYRKFSSSGASLGDRAFKYVPGLGASDLGALLPVEPYSEGWDLLGQPVRSNTSGQIVGHGLLSGYRSSVPTRPYSQGVYLLQD